MVDGKKLRVAEYKQLMKSRRQEVRHLWYDAASYNSNSAVASNTRYMNGETSATWRPLSNVISFYLVIAKIVQK